MSDVDSVKKAIDNARQAAMKIGQSMNQGSGSSGSSSSTESENKDNNDNKEEEKKN